MSEGKEDHLGCVDFLAHSKGNDLTRQAKFSVGVMGQANISSGLVGGLNISIYIGYKVSSYLLLRLYCRKFMSECKKVP